MLDWFLENGFYLLGIVVVALVGLLLVGLLMWLGQDGQVFRLCSDDAGRTWGDSQVVQAGKLEADMECRQRFERCGLRGAGRGAGAVRPP